MSPPEFFSKAREEAASGDGAGFWPADIGDVGERAVQLFLVFVIQRQLPGAVVGGQAGGENLLYQFVVVAHQAGDIAAQGHDAGAGEGGDVDHAFGLEALGVGQRVAQDQAAFGIGVADLDVQAGAGLEDVARSVGIAGDGVFHRRDQQRQLHRQLQCHHQAGQAQGIGGAAHVLLHLAHALAALDVQAAGVEADALADEGQGLGARLAAVPLHDRQLAFATAALADAEQRPHTELLHLLLAEHLDASAAARAARRAAPVMTPPSQAR